MTALVVCITWLAILTAQPAAPLPAVQHLAGVPLAEGTRNWCGPAALAAVLRYQGERTSAKEIADAIYLPSFHGALNLDLLVFARRRGYEASAGAGSAGDMQRALAAGHPVICMLREQHLLASANHFVVVRGYDTAREVWFVDAGEGRERTVRFADFDSDWARCGRWRLVVTGRARPTAEVSRGL